MHCSNLPSKSDAPSMALRSSRPGEGCAHVASCQPPPPRRHPIHHAPQSPHPLLYYEDQNCFTRHSSSDRHTIILHTSLIRRATIGSMYNPWLIFCIDWINLYMFRLILLALHSFFFGINLTLHRKHRYALQLTN